MGERYVVDVLPVCGIEGHGLYFNENVVISNCARSLVPCLLRGIHLFRASPVFDKETFYNGIGFARMGGHSSGQLETESKHTLRNRDVGYDSLGLLRNSKCFSCRHDENVTSRVKF